MVGAFYATAEEKRRAWCEGGGGQVKSLQPESGLQQLPAVPVPGPQDAAQRSRTRQDAQRMPAWRTPPLPFPCRAHAHREAEQLAAARAQAAAAHAARDAQWAAQPQRVVVDTQRPWNAASTTYYMPAEVEAEARRRQQREAAEANRAAVQYRAAAEARARAAEQTALHAAMAAEVSAGRGGGAATSPSHHAWAAQADKQAGEHWQNARGLSKLPRAALRSVLQFPAQFCSKHCPLLSPHGRAGHLLQPGGRQRALDPARATRQAARRRACAGRTCRCFCFWEISGLGLCKGQQMQGGWAAAEAPWLP